MLKIMKGRGSGQNPSKTSNRGVKGVQPRKIDNAIIFSIEA